jgi:3-hydroxyisobutyrate dehydrogenase-like beta-hydroxyacid dehydrogenase
MGPPNALNGTGTIMVSGPQAVYDRVKDALAEMTGTMKYFGERPDLAAVYKLMGNAMILAVVGGLNDVYRIAEERGLDRESAYDLFSFYNVQGQIDGRGKRMAERDYSPAWTLDMAHKDATLMQGAANGVELPVIDAIECELAAAKDRGAGAKDLGAVSAR